jgi:hypothetical protein
VPTTSFLEAAFRLSFSGFFSVTVGNHLAGFFLKEAWLVMARSSGPNFVFRENLEKLEKLFYRPDRTCASKSSFSRFSRKTKFSQKWRFVFYLKNKRNTVISLDLGLSGTRKERD